MNRKATFAKRQRETDLKDHARSKEARRVARKDSSRTGKGPEIAWDQAVYPTADNPDDAPVTNAGAQVPASGTAGAPTANAAPATPPAPPNAASHAKAHEAAAAGTKAAAEKAGEKPNGQGTAKQGSSKLGPRLPSLVPRDDSAS
jgi:hypothetical protein